MERMLLGEGNVGVGIDGYRAVFFDTPQTGPIGGTVRGTLFKTPEQLGAKVVLEFTTTESVDVVITVLQQIKQLLEKHEVK